jgi:hypothetical protein
MTLTTMQKSSVGESSGSVTDQASRISPAPSMRAASSISRGIPWSPLSTSTV